MCSSLMLVAAEDNLEEGASEWTNDDCVHKHVNLGMPTQEKKIIGCFD